ncbi:MAG: hypothetical protein P4L85_22290 [Paludisphaera borealis]|uniref:tetratricopeptide repeat protein n=1 Tax=Paludisphaera borealis TaxID=1387353 RepID=UPI0028515413|nr:tetratricopeptide repeat protein [Paludisphaera borealis]MDR3622096.1 hypothetical protein [Paludisphaera borealis]
MSTDSPPQAKLRSSPATDKGRTAGAPGGSSWGLRLFDVALVGLFLALAFLLGVFPLKDTDFFWHLRTGDLIRKTGQIPRIDFYTFTRDGTPWIDLHWMFQVGVSWIYERGGVPALTLAKCVITCAALLLLITARRRTWPVWTMILAWIPALLVLSGRMYVRPETLSLFYLSIYLAVLCRWDRRPWLAWLLPFVQVAWVNSHGLFVLGPIVLGFGLLDAALRSRSFGGDRKRWWAIAMSASAATGLACLLNPYGIHGALYPLELASTMNNPVFTDSIAELQSIPRFIMLAGIWVLPLQLHFATIALGALSFLIPIVAIAAARVRATLPSRSIDGNGDPSAGKPRKGNSLKASGKTGDARRKPRRKQAAVGADETGWRISLLRLLLFAAFTMLSFRATRNSHQFAAVVGTVTAWNFAEWVGARNARRSAGKSDASASDSDGIRPRLVALVALILLVFAVGSGQFYSWTGEGRQIGWGEEPLWFPHAASRFAGGPEMPDRFLSYHNGLASVFLYYHSPERPGGPGKTVFTDPRLEVTGPELYARYKDIQTRINGEQAGWQGDLDAIGRPTIMVDHQDNSQTGAVLLGSDRWRCVWFDELAAVFVHDSYKAAVAARQVDFGARHFRPDAAFEPHGVPALIAAAKGLRNYVNFHSMSRGDLARPMIWLGLDYARRVVEAVPDSLEGWKTIGLIEMLRDPLLQPTPRFRLPFDPIFDLSPIRSTYALKRAVEIAPRDFLSLIGLQSCYQDRLLFEPLAPLLDEIVTLRPINPHQVGQQIRTDALRNEVRQRLGPAPATTWRNLGELDQMVEDQLAHGRAESVAKLLERAYTPEQAPWETVERLANLYLHLGDPAQARATLTKAGAVPRPAVRDARLAVCELAQGRFAEARQLYQQAIAQEPNLFEARYGLAVVEQDAGRAGAAYEQALAAVDCAPSDAARVSARAIASAVGRFAGE